MTYDFRATPQGGKAQQIRDQLAQQTEWLRNNDQYSPAGKKQQVAALYREAKQKLQALEKEAEAAKEQKVAALRRDLFGMQGTADPSTAISYRDAQERVARLTFSDGDKAAALLGEAELSGDEVLVKAVIRRAIDAGWADVANTYIDQHPYYGQKLEELWDMTDRELTTTALFNASAFDAPKPAELGDVHTDHQLNQLADTG